MRCLQYVALLSYNKSTTTEDTKTTFVVLVHSFPNDDRWDLHKREINTHVIIVASKCHRSSTRCGWRRLETKIISKKTRINTNCIIKFEVENKLKALDLEVNEFFFIERETFP